MPVLKHADAAPLLNDPTIVLDLGDLQRQAARMIAAAEQEAERILASAREAAEDEGRRLRAEAEAIGRAEGERAGRATGETAGHEEAMATTSAALGQLQSAWIEALEDWERRRRAELAAGREDVVALAIAIAERLVHRTIDLEPGVVVEQAAAALDLLAQARDVRVAVHASDRERMAEAMPELARRLAADASVQVVVDDALAPGDVVVRCGDGVIDARIQVQLERITEALVPGRSTTLLPVRDAGVAAESVAATVDAAPSTRLRDGTPGAGEDRPGATDAPADAMAGEAVATGAAGNEPDATSAGEAADETDAMGAAGAAGPRDATDATDASGAADETDATGPTDASDATDATDADPTSNTSRDDAANDVGADGDADEPHGLGAAA